MRVLMLHPHDVRYHPWTIRVIKLAEELTGFGHQVIVGFIEHKRAQEPDFPRLRDITLDSLNDPVFPDPGNVRYIPLRARDNQTHKNILDVIRLAKEADIIHFQKCFASAFIPALWASYRWNKPLHYDWDDNETLILNEINHLPFGFRAQARFLEERVPSFVDTISVSSDALGKICERMGFPASRIRKVPVGADLQCFDPNRSGDTFRRRQPLAIGDRPLVVYIGQLEGAAYAGLFVKACGLLADRFPDAVWMVVGGGPMLAELELLAYELNLSHRLIFTDYLPSDTIPDVLASADIAVACFADEEFARCKSPLKVAEYMAAGKAIVASRVGEVPWMTQGASILVEPGSDEELAKGIGQLLKNPGLRQELGKAARNRAESVVNWKQSARNLEEAYQVALKG
jgi:glycosyltransferase involved in cell wall biosynthesis